jgi:hypothetical protein
VTRDVEPSALEDVRKRPPRATVAFIDGERVEVLPVQARYGGGTYRFGVLPAVATQLTDREVVLVIDDGAYFFELRGISVRGVATRIDETDPLVWYVIEPRRILGWDYAALRET